MSSTRDFWTAGSRAATSEQDRDEESRTTREANWANNRQTLDSARRHWIGPLIDHCTPSTLSRSHSYLYLHKLSKYYPAETRRRALNSLIQPAHPVILPQFSQEDEESSRGKYYFLFSFFLTESFRNAICHAIASRGPPSASVVYSKNGPNWNAKKKRRGESGARVSSTAPASWYQTWSRWHFLSSTEEGNNFLFLFLNIFGSFFSLLPRNLILVSTMDWFQVPDAPVNWFIKEVGDLFKLCHV